MMKLASKSNRALRLIPSQSNNKYRKKNMTYTYKQQFLPKFGAQLWT